MFATQQRVTCVRKPKICFSIPEAVENTTLEIMEKKKKEKSGDTWTAASVVAAKPAKF